MIVDMMEKYVGWCVAGLGVLGYAGLYSIGESIGRWMVNA